MTHSTVSGNAGESSGGVDNDAGTVTITNSTISGNTGYFGGGVRNGGSMTLKNSTVSGNLAGQAGGVNIIGGSASLTLTQTLISGNTAAPTGDPELASNSGTVIADDFNLFGHSGDAGVSGFTPGPTDIVPTDSLTAILDTTLSDNGGPTPTHLLEPGSPAVDAVPAAACATSTDQRGVSRPQGSACDIGAFEAVPSPDLAVSLADLPDPASIGNDLIYTVAVNNAGLGQATGVTIIDTLPAGVDFVSATSPQGNCAEEAGTVSCTLGDLAGGASAMATVVVRPTVDGTITNSAEVSANETDDNPANDRASETTLVNQVPITPAVPRAICDDLKCRIPLTCDRPEALGMPCTNRVNVFTRVRSSRSTDALAGKASRRVKFATAVTNVPPGQTVKVRLRPTKSGEQIIRKTKLKTLRGVLEISNSPGTARSRRSIRIRLR
jgi:uncharacterized repeat protein (TIGR01451 family)